MIDNVTLTEAEIHIADWVGEQRHAYALSYKLDPGLGPTSRAKDAEHDRRGARAEYAGSIILNVYWRPTIGSIRDRDVGGIIEIRTTVLPHGRLIVKPKDDDNVPFGLVIIDSVRSYRLRGWLWSQEVKKWPLLTYPDTDPAHYAPQDSLRPIETLKGEADART